MDREVTLSQVQVAAGVTSMVLLFTPGNLCYRAETETTVLLSCPHPTVTTQSPSRPEEFLRSPKEVSSSQCCCQCVQGAWDERSSIYQGSVVHVPYLQRVIGWK